MLNKWIETLEACQLFRDTKREDLQKMMACFNPIVKEYKKNEMLTIEGDRFGRIGIMLVGEAAVTKENAAGDRVIIEIIGPGMMFGEMAAYSGAGVWPATVVALSHCKTIYLPADKIAGNCENQCVSHKKLINNMLMIVSNKALMLNKKVQYLAMKSLRSKISAFLLEHYKSIGKSTFLLPLKRNDLADYLNVSRPSLSREMCRMRDEGLIEFHMASIRIKKVEELRRLVR